MTRTRWPRIDILKYFCLLLFPAGVFSLTFNSVAAEDGANAPIYPYSRVVAKWTWVATDPVTINLKILWASGATTPFVPNIGSGQGGVVASIGDVDAPAVYKIVAYNGAGPGGTPIIAASDPFAVQALTTLGPHSTGTPSIIPPGITTTTAAQTSSSAPSQSTAPSSTSNQPSTESQAASTTGNSTPDQTIVFSDSSSQSSSARPFSSSQSQGQPTGTSAHGKSPVGAIAGSVVGGIVLSTAIAVLVLFLLRRRRPASVSSEPIRQTNILSTELQSEPFVPPSSGRPFEKPGGPAVINRERDAMLQQQAVVQANSKTRQRLQPQSNQTNQGPSPRVELLMERNQALADRILELEAQHGVETVVAHETLPPDYTVR